MNRIVKGSIKIKPELWLLMLNGIKNKEFRKLSKGIVEGDYQFVSIETVSEANDEFEVCDDGCLNCAGNEICWKGNLPNEIYGIAHLTPVKIYSKSNSTLGDLPKIDKPSRDFIRDHYLREHDYVEYDISNISNTATVLWSEYKKGTRAQWLK